MVALADSYVLTEVTSLTAGPLTHTFEGVVGFTVVPFVLGKFTRRTLDSCVPYLAEQEVQVL